jgi:16S rRNA (cytosine967-C5)-methyltransferase
VSLRNKGITMSQLGLAARKATLQMLHAVLMEKRMLAQIEPYDGLEPDDIARAKRLCAEVLRHLGRADALIDRYIERNPPLAVRNVLRLGVVELLIDGSSAHGVVNSLVTVAKRSARTTRSKGLINAVLRSIAEEGPEIWPDLPPQRMPTWMRKPLVKSFGAEAVLAIEAAHQAGAKLDLTEKIADSVDLPNAERLPTGSLRVPMAQITALPGYDTGDWWVQNAAAALPARLLGDVAGLRVLDLCAAPGGKTMQLAAAGAHVTALDISETRLVRVQENLDRTGLSAKLVCADVLDWHAEPFDAVLLDAPCSATGTIRRHPDISFVKTAEDAERLTRLQAQMIDAALGLLKPSGRMVFCTCSLLANEGENQLKAALKRHEDVTVVDIDPVDFGGTSDWKSPEGGLRLRPDFWGPEGGLDGFYMAALQKR